MIMLRTNCVAAFVFFACAGLAFGTVTTLEQFNYTPAGSDLSGNGGGGSSGFNGNWSGDTSFDLASGSLVSPVPLASISGNRVTAAAFGGNRDIARNFTQTIGADNTTIYFSFLMRAQDVVGGGAFGGYFEFVLRAGQRYVCVGKGGANNNYLIEGSTLEKGVSSVPVVANQTHLFVVRANFLPGADNYRLYIDPQTGQAEPSVANAVLSTYDVGTVTGLTLSGPGAFGFDELRFGTTWNDVTPVPEPGTLVLMITGFLPSVFLLRQLRRSKC